jgi:uncharacterized protein (TIGR00251 family)
MRAPMRKTARPEGALLSVRVQPRARRDEVVGGQGATLRVRVAAPPIDGRANQAVIGVLAEALGLPRASIGLVSGAAGRDKLFRIARHSPDDLRALLDRRLTGVPT